ncbi:MAG: hypothetical protein CL910_22065 [Deltaproteobacteria bacterium]|nr:hypothetical protein [Deltaproteobacteria bacterium]
MKATPVRSFSEREFYLREFRGRTLAIVAPEPSDLGHPVVGDTLAALRGAGARAIVVAADGGSLQKVVAAPPASPEAPSLEGEVWRALASDPIQAVCVSPGAFAAQARALAVRLGLFKVVWLDGGGGLRSESEGRHAFVHLEELAGWLAHEGRGLATTERLGLWREIADLLEAGIPAVNVCDAPGLADELFTYSGRGTLFTRERYITVRSLGVDDYDAAHDLIARGVAEGYLAPRETGEVDRILAAAFGAFVEGRDLAGIGALLSWGDMGEISSLYTLTRFLGEGVGQHLVHFALERAQALGLQGVFACTTAERVGAFFERQGFTWAEPATLPAEKWQGYDPARRSKLRCYIATVGAPGAR